MAVANYVFQCMPENAKIDLIEPTQFNTWTHVGLTPSNAIGWFLKEKSCARKMWIRVLVNVKAELDSDDTNILNS